MQSTTPPTLLSPTPHPTGPLTASEVAEAVAWYNMRAIAVPAVAIPGGIEFTRADRTVTVLATGEDDFTVSVRTKNGETLAEHRGISYGRVGGVARKASLEPLGD